MPTRHLVLGLDGADLDVVRGLGPEALPNLHHHMAVGVHSAQQSVQPPATLPNWTTFLTGVDPAQHGVFDFTTKHGYDVRFSGGTVREAPTLFERLDAMGRRCACVAFPATYPPPRLEHGVFISGWDSPVAFEADRSFVSPPSLYDAMEKRFGPWRFDDADEMNADQPGWHARLPSLLEARIRRKVAVAEWLMDRESWDVFALYFGESDTAAHHLWAFHDAGSPRSPSVSDAERDGLARVYRALDTAVGALTKASGDDVELTIVSDHGSGGSSDVVLHLNRALAEAGLLEFHPARGGVLGDLVGRAKQLALTRLPPRLRERIFRLAGGRLPGWLESRARFGAIAMERTRAFSDELNYFPGVWLNLEGREPAGTVPATEREPTIREVERVLLALRDPWNGAPVVDTVWRREELYRGPHIERAPDLLLRLHLREGYSYNVQPSGGPGEIFRKLDANEHLGKKGRSLQGSHRERGLFVASGPRIEPVGEIESDIADAAATLLARMDVAVPPDAVGRVLFEALRGTAGTVEALPDVAPPAHSGRADEAEVEKRLRALGYVD
ncbi:MAG: alkaline phosphatase family protein [Deltaproteobacteria bacterium]|nr:alkaline phosphatase family protein [Deltaproteobacteria bacterium]